jgi:hypothetical protein
MLNKPHHHSSSSSTTPTFLEGTKGLYQRRESPPNASRGGVPAQTFNSTPLHAQYYRHQSNPGSSTQLHSVNIAPNYNTNAFPSFFGQAPRPSASSTSLPMVASGLLVPTAAPPTFVTTTSSYVPQYTQNQVGLWNLCEQNFW